MKQLTSRPVADEVHAQELILRVTIAQNVINGLSSMVFYTSDSPFNVLMAKKLIEETLSSFEFYEYTVNIAPAMSRDLYFDIVVRPIGKSDPGHHFSACFLVQP